MYSAFHHRPPFRAQELCESRGGHPGLPSLINLRFLWTYSNTSSTAPPPPPSPPSLYCHGDLGPRQYLTGDNSALKNKKKSAWYFCRQLHETSQPSNFNAEVKVVGGTLDQTPSTGVPHPSSNHCRRRLRHRPRKTVNLRTVFRWCSNGS